MRLKKKETAVYHCLSHVLGDQTLLDEESRQVFEAMLWKVADFSGVEVLAFCILPHRVDLLVRVPEAQPGSLTRSELLRRYGLIYGENYVGVFPREEKLAALLRDAGSAEARSWERRLTSRMNDISAFMKTLKQRYSWWYNRRHVRNGALWRERFKATLVDDTPAARSIAAAFIDLKPVRFGLVEDPEDYPWSSFGAAVRGNSNAQKGLASVLGKRSWERCQDDYLARLYGTGSE